MCQFDIGLNICSVSIMPQICRADTVIRYRLTSKEIINAKAQEADFQAEANQTTIVLIFLLWFLFFFVSCSFLLLFFYTFPLFSISSLHSSSIFRFIFLSFFPSSFLTLRICFLSFPVSHLPVYFITFVPSLIFLPPFFFNIGFPFTSVMQVLSSCYR